MAYVIPHAEIALDAADLTVDDGWLDPLAEFLSQARVVYHVPNGGCDEDLAHFLRLAGRPIVEDYVAPKCPRIVQVDALHVSSIRLAVWCSMRLQNVRFLPSYVRAAIRLISLSGRFTLDGAAVTLPKRSLPVYRGSLQDFARSLAAEYTVNLLRNLGTVLGKSSVLKLPRAPLKLAGTAMSLVTDGVGLAAGEAAALLNELTFDEEFVARQRQQQGVKQIRGIGDGVVEAGKSIAQGVEGLLDVVKKPVQGARSSGLGGFFAGVGVGVAGSLVKPVSRLGQVVGTPEVKLNSLLAVSYDGSFSKGSCYNRNDPKQNGQPKKTVEGLLEVALRAVSNSTAYVCLASRTDKGVSAKINYGVGFLEAAFFETTGVNETNRWLEENGFALRLCDLRPLPPALQIHWASRGMVCDKITERKRYHYFITHGGSAMKTSHEGCQPWHFKDVLNITAMRESAETFVGEHNFHAFTSQHGLQRNGTRRVLDIRVRRVGTSSPELLCISILGESFLYRMVRYIVCALILVGRQRATRPMLRQLLDPSLESSARQRQKQQLQLRPAPAQGLQLAEVQLNPLVFSTEREATSRERKEKGDDRVFLGGHFRRWCWSCC
eukprot:symbB.v1.2.026771.t1/scaffold2699.1/size140064/6